MIHSVSNRSIYPHPEAVPQAQGLEEWLAETEITPFGTTPAGSSQDEGASSEIGLAA